MHRLTFLLAVVMIGLAATGCRWLEATVPPDFMPEALTSDNAQEQAIRKAALQDRSFPAAGDPVSGSQHR